MKKYRKFFLLGCLFGVLIFAISILFLDNITNPTLAKFFALLIFPGVIIPIDTVLHWLAKLFNSKIDYGLGFDAGPLVWVEWSSWIITTAICYGLIFVLVLKIVTWYKQRKNSR